MDEQQKSDALLGPMVEVEFNKLTVEERDALDEAFMYHGPDEVQAAKYQMISTEARKLAELVMLLCPPSADRTVALRDICSARMWANASIARNGKSLR